MKKLFIIMALALMPMQAFSTLWLLNGNFSLSYTDIDEGSGLALDRFYNSLSIVKGMFGYGWGTHFETRLYVVDGPYVMIEEVPGGGRSHYMDKGNNSLSKLADRYLKAVNAGNNGKEYVNKLRNTLLKEPTLLFEYARGYKMYGKIKDGTVLDSVERSGERLKKVKGGYVRYKADGMVDDFDNDGRIIKRTPKAEKSIYFSYSSNGKLQTIKDQTGKSINFFFNNKGFVERATLYNGKTAGYFYDDNDNLIRSTDINGKTYDYKYDAYHRIVEVALPAGEVGPKSTKWVIGYDTETGKVVYQKTPQGWEVFTEYANDKGKDQYYDSVSVTKKFGNEVIPEKYEFWKRPNPDGSLYTYKTRQKIGKNEKMVTYTMCCSTPLVINENGKITRFEYNKDGKLKKKVMPDGTIIDVRYDDKKHVSGIINNGVPYAFKYNESGQIILAASHDLKFKMEYDNYGNASKIMDNKGNSFSFKYDGSGRLKEVFSKEVSLVVEYANNGSPIVKPKNTSDDIDKMLAMRKVYLDYIDIMSVFKLIDLEN